MARGEAPLIPDPPQSLASRPSTLSGANAVRGGEAGLLDESPSASPRVIGQDTCLQGAMKQPTVQVVIAVIIGLVLGNLLFGYKGEEGFDQWVPSVGLLLRTPGTLWLKALKCIVLPMIIFAMIDAMIMMRSLPGAKYVATSLLTWYTILPLSAGTQAIIYANLLVIPNIEQSITFPNSTDETTAAPTPPPSLLETLLGIANNMVPANLVEEMAINNLLPIIVAALCFGLLVREKEEDGSLTTAMEVIRDMNAVVFSVIGGLMSVTPFAISSLVFGAVYTNGMEGISDARFLILGTVASLLSHFCLFYPVILAVFGRRQPFRYLLNLVPAFLQALGTSSSAAALPVSTRMAIERNKIAPHIAQFVISLGATIGMDGTAMYLITAVIFIGSIQGKIFGIGDFITLALMAALSAAGSAPIPNASLFLMTLIGSAVGVTIRPDDIAMVSAVDWALDRLRTCVNVAGDQVVASIMDVKFGAMQDAENLDMGQENMGQFLQEQDKARRTRTKSIISLR